MEETCPFQFNFDPTTFKVGDTVSYRVPEQFATCHSWVLYLAVGDD